MKNRKGLTLVEALISVTMLTAVSLILVAGVMHVYSSLIKMKSLTTDTYSAMQEVENIMQDIRVELHSATPDLAKYNTINYSVFGTMVTAYEVSVTSEYGSMWTLVGEYTYGELPTPSITVTAMLLNGNLSNASYLNNSLLADSNETLDTENASLYLMTTYRWYVSKEGYYIRSNDESDYLSSGYYPNFPEDYVAIGGSAGISSSIRLNSGNYLGRHVIIAAAPVAASGKMGAQAISNPVYISGLPLTDSSLKMHLDASLISLGDYDTYSSGSGRINNWTDFSGNGHSAAISPADIPIANTTTQFGGSYANVLDFSEGTMQLQSALEGMSECTLFAVVHAEPDSISSKFLSGNNWSLALDQFNLGENSLAIHGVSAKNWYVLGITVNKSGDAGVLSVTVNDGEAQEIPMNYADLQIDSGNIRIGTDGVMMAEIIIYNEALESGSYGNIRDYLLKKYRP